MKTRYNNMLISSFGNFKFLKKNKKNLKNCMKFQIQIEKLEGLCNAVHKYSNAISIINNLVKKTKILIYSK